MKFAHILHTNDYISEGPCRHQCVPVDIFVNPFRFTFKGTDPEEKFQLQVI